MTLLAVVGDADVEFTVHLLCRMLEEMPRVRVGVITPNGGYMDGIPIACVPRPEVETLLKTMADARCTHVIFLLDSGMLRRGECANLRMSVTALSAAVPEWEELGDLLTASDMVVLNLDEGELVQHLDTIASPIFTYSERKSEADLVAKNLRLFPGYTEFEAVSIGQIQRFHLPVPGGLALYHALCVIACGICLGLSCESMVRPLRSTHGPRGQMEVLSVPAVYTVVLDRADTPNTVERLLACAREFTAGRLMCVLRCPVPCGRDRAAQLGGVMGQMADRVILTCDSVQALDVAEEIRAGMDGWDCPCVAEPDRQRAVFRALEHAQPGDVIVLAGCDGANPSVPDERELVRSYIRHRHLRREAANQR